MDPRGKGVFLTGGAQGLGRGIVEELLSLGAKVRKLLLYFKIEFGNSSN